MREEADGFVEMLWEEGSLGTLPEDASKFRKLQRQAVQCLIVVIICLMVDYVIWILSTGTLNCIILIVTFNSIIYLTYWLLGPIVWWGYVKVIGHLETATALMLTHYISSAIVICTAFVAAVAYNCCVRFRRSLNLPQTESYTTISRRLAGIENQLEKILNEIEKVKTESKNHRRKK